MKNIGNMKDLKQHIEESLLDDFETIEAASKKDLDAPFSLIAFVNSFIDVVLVSFIIFAPKLSISLS